MSRKGILSIFLLLFLNTLPLEAQQAIRKEKQGLSSILTDLQKNYNISFSYKDSNIKDIKILPPKNNITIKELLTYLEKETKLDFQLLDNYFIVIKKRKAKAQNHISQRLEEIIITNYLTKGIYRLNDGSINIKPKGFGILPGLIEPDVLQIIQALPGISSTDETVSNINIRGGTNDQNLLLWDGIKMYQSSHFFGLISAFNPYTTKSINVYKNGTTSEYGDSVSGVIDMRLPDQIDNKFKAGLGFNMINSNGFAKIPLSHNTELQISARRSLNDFIETPTYNQYTKRAFQDSDLANFNQSENFSFYDVTAKFLYNITNKDKLRFNFLNINNNLNFEEQSRINGFSEILNNQLSQKNMAGGITYIRDWNTKISMSSQLYLSNYALNAINFDILNNQRLIQENEVFDGCLKLGMNYRLNNLLKIKSGYQFTEVGVSNLEDINIPNYRKYIKQVIRSHSLYSEGSYVSKNEKTNLRIGSRLNYIKKLDAILLEPRLSLSQKLLNYFKLEVLGEFKSQTISQVIDLQNDFLGVEKRRWVLSNNKNNINNTIGETHVPIIKSKQISTAVSYNHRKTLISVEAYQKKVKGITTRSQGFQNQYQFVNAIGNYEIKGIDFLVNKQINNIFSTWLSYSISKNNYTFDTLNNGNSFSNNIDIRHLIALSGAYTYNNVKFALGLNWHSGKPNTPPNFNADPRSEFITYTTPPNNDNLEDYLRIDCSAKYRFDISNKTKGVLGVSLWNLLNKKNIINTYYTKNQSFNLYKIDNQSLGITPNISIRLLF